MAVQSFNPRIKVTLKKTIRARAGVLDRFQGAAAEIDLSPYLGEGSAVTTSRGINQPAGGFTIRVSDRLYPAQRQVSGAVDSLYALVEPMDMIEIRMQRDPTTGAMPLVMRGLVSTITSDETVSADGRPQRTVTVAGQDWGKWLQILQIKYLRGQPIADTLAQMTGALLQYSYGIAYLTMNAGEFVQELVDKVINPFIFNVVGDENGGGLPVFKVDVDGADPVDKVFPYGYQSNPQGTMWTYLSNFGNLGPFYELIIDDEDDGPTLVYRKPPFMTLDDSEKVFEAAPDVDVYDVAAREVIKSTVERGDADVANWYFVQSGRTQLMRSIDVLLNSIATKTEVVSGADYANSKRSLFGIRLMEVETQHGAIREPGAKEATVRENDVDLTNYLVKQIEYLKKSNQDNVMFEHGSLVLQGRETFRPGRYFELSRRDLKSRGYITNVAQSYEPFSAWRTTLTFARGTGFVNRSRRDGDGPENPYRTMIGRGVYDET